MKKNQIIFLHFFMAISAYIILISCQIIDNPFSIKFESGTKLGIIENRLLTEASGMVASRTNPDHLWVINDSGNDPQLHLIDQNGQLVKSYWIENTSNFDWEDMAIYSDPESGISHIYIADIGDNFAIRDHIKIIIFPEPKYSNNQDTLITPTSTFCFRYEDGPRDAETLLVDPWNSDVFIISKREENVRLYQAANFQSNTDTTELIFKTSLPFQNVTAGDISMNGDEILLKNYNAVFYWSRAKTESIAEILTKPHEILRYAPEPQGESIAWDNEGTGYFTLSERNQPKEQVLYFYKRK